MKELIDSIANLAEGLAKLTPVGLFVLSVILTIVVNATFPSYTWLLVIADIITGVIAVAWVWSSISRH
jgi:hypothetical protein